MSSVQSLFPTLIYHAPLQRAAVATRAFNRRLLREAWQLAEDDTAGQRWSKHNYPGGYTSYGSLCRLQQLSPTFAELERRFDAKIDAGDRSSRPRSFAIAIEGDGESRTLETILQTGCQ